MAIDSPAHFAAHAGRSAGGARAGSGNRHVCVAAVCAIAAHGVAAANFVQYRQRLRRCLARHRCQSQPKCAHAGSSFGAVGHGGGAALAGGDYADGNGKWHGVAAGVFAWLARLAGVFAAGRADDCGSVGIHLGAATVWLSRFGRSGGVFEFWLAGSMRQCVFANAHAACRRVAARRRKWIIGSKCVAYQQYTRFIQRLGSGQTHVGK